MVINYVMENWVEIAGALLSMVYLYFSIREKSLLWLFGFISSALYIAVFFDKQLYAEMSINFYYVFVSIYGWITWQRKSAETSETVLMVTTIDTLRELFTYIAAAIAIYFAYYFVLEYLTDSPIAAADSVVGALSIVATWMLARKKLENWLVFIAVDAYAAGLYLWKGLYPTFILFIVYTIMAVVGYREWKRNMESKSVVGME